MGNTVDIKKATYTNDIGDSQLIAEWTDPDFDPTKSAAYYVRVLEIPTPRWSTYDAKKLGVEPPTEAPDHSGARLVLAYLVYAGGMRQWSSGAVELVVAGLCAGLGQ